MKIPVAVSILALLLLESIVAQQTIRFGVSLSTTGTTGRANAGRHIKRGLEIWRDWSAARGPIRLRNGQDYVFDFYHLEDNANATTLVSNYNRLLNDSSIQFLLGPVHSDFSLLVKPLTDPAQRLLMSPSAASTLYYNTTYGENFALSIVTAASRFLLPSLPYLRLAGAKSLFFINENLGIHRQFCGAITPSVALDQGLTVKGRLQIPTIDNPNVTDENKAVLESAVTAALESNADAIVGCMYGAAAQALLQIFYDRQVAPKAFVFVTFTESEWNRMPQHLSNFVAGVEQYDSRTNWPSDVFVGPSTNFTSIYTQRYGEAPDEYAAFGALAGYGLQWAIEKSPDPFNQAAVRDTLIRINVPTFMGLYSYGVDGANYLPTIFYQYVNNKRVVVGPPSVSSGVDFVYPFPTWYERSPHVYFGRNTAESVVTAFVILFTIGSILFAIGVIKYWSHDVIRAASPPFLLAFLLGSVILYLSVLTWPITSISMSICHLRIWAIGLGFVLLFAPLIIKSYRIHRLWANESVEIVKITNTHLGAILAAVLLVEIILIILSTTVSGYTVERVVLDPYRSTNDYDRCSSIGVGFLSALLVYKAIILLAGLVLAFLLRRVKYDLYNESKPLAFAVYNVSFFCILITIIHLAASNIDPAVLFILRAIATIAGTGITVGTLFITKFNYIRAGATALSRKSTSASRVRTAGMQSSGSLHLSAVKAAGSGHSSEIGSPRSDSDKRETALVAEVESLNKKNKRLKRQVKSLELKVSELEALLKSGNNGDIEADATSSGADKPSSSSSDE